MPRVVVVPTDEEELAAVLAFADREGLKVLPRGGGTRQGMGFPPRGGDIVLSLERLSALVEHAPADQTMTTQAGMPLAALQAVLAHARQRLALDPLHTPASTIGGILSTNASGPRRLRYGGARDLLIGIRVALADGTLAKGGGKVVKNVAGYDLPKLYIGALGTLGVITSATFRLHPLPTAMRTLALAARELSALGDVVSRVLASTLTPALLDLWSPEAPGGPSVLVATFESSVPAAIEQQCAALLELARLVAGVEECAAPSRPPALEGARVLRLKASVLLTEVIPWLTALERLAGESELTTSWRAHAGHGLIGVSLCGPDSALMAAVEALRAVAMARQGSLVVEDAPPDLAERLDMWGPSPAELLMRRIKAQFDPHQTLNPGRFLGRI
jgi:glycolate oxidase FAD binding subunit